MTTCEIISLLRRSPLQDVNGELARVVTLYRVETPLGVDLDPEDDVDNDLCVSVRKVEVYLGYECLDSEVQEDDPILYLNGEDDPEPITVSSLFNEDGTQSIVLQEADEKLASQFFETPEEAAEAAASLIKAEVMRTFVPTS